MIQDSSIFASNLALLTYSFPSGGNGGASRNVNLQQILSEFPPDHLSHPQLCHQLMERRCVGTDVQVGEDGVHELLELLVCLRWVDLQGVKQQLGRLGPHGVP